MVSVTLSSLWCFIYSHQAFIEHVSEITSNNLLIQQNESKHLLEGAEMNIKIILQPYPSWGFIEKWMKNILADFSNIHEILAVKTLSIWTVLNSTSKYIWQAMSYLWILMDITFLLELGTTGPHTEPKNQPMVNCQLINWLKSNLHKLY